MRLRRALDLTPAAADALRRLPPTLIHGDYHVRNIGIGGGGGLTVIDWANTGIAPLGSDVAVSLSVYELFGGRGGSPSVDRRAIDSYADAVSTLDGVDRRADVERAVQLWNLTWGLHLRLGLGLSALLENWILDPAELRRSIADVVSGVDRGLAALDATGW